MSTKIEWTGVPGTKGETWNPFIGCSKVSAGCKNCYAETMAGTRLVNTPHGAIYKDVIGEDGRWNGRTRFVESALGKPLKWKKPRTIFVCSMSDLFHEENANEDIAAVFGAMAACPQHTFQVLTKRPERMAKWFDWLSSRVEYFGWRSDNPRADFCLHETWKMNSELVGDLPDSCEMLWPLPNVWLGASIENYTVLGERIEHLERCPAVVHWLSIEPQLEGVHFGARLSGIDWVVVGGESGLSARPFHLGWAEDLLEQCQHEGVAFFMKQMGWNPYRDGKPWKLKSRKGNDMSEWPEHMRVREFPALVELEG